MFDSDSNDGDNVNKDVRYGGGDGKIDGDDDWLFHKGKRLAYNNIRWWNRCDNGVALANLMRIEYSIQCKAIPNKKLKHSLVW